MSFSEITSLFRSSSSSPSSFSAFPIFFFPPLCLPLAISATLGRQRRGRKKIFKNNHNKKKKPPILRSKRKRGSGRSRPSDLLRKRKGRYRRRQRGTVAGATFAAPKGGGRKGRRYRGGTLFLPFMPNLCEEESFGAHRCNKK